MKRIVALNYDFENAFNIKTCEDFKVVRNKNELFKISDKVKINKNNESVLLDLTFEKKFNSSLDYLPDLCGKLNCRYIGETNSNVSHLSVSSDNIETELRLLNSNYIKSYKRLENIDFDKIIYIPYLISNKKINILGVFHKRSSYFVTSLIYDGIQMIVDEKRIINIIDILSKQLNINCIGEIMLFIKDDIYYIYKLLHNPIRQDGSFKYAVHQIIGSKNINKIISFVFDKYLEDV